MGKLGDTVASRFSDRELNVQLAVGSVVGKLGIQLVVGSVKGKYRIQLAVEWVMKKLSYSWQWDQ